MKLVILPKYLAAVRALDYDEAGEDTLLTRGLLEAEYKNRFTQGLFDWLNRQCGVLIDEYEDGLIPYEKLRRVKTELAKSADSGIVKLYNLVCETINRQTGICFYYI